MPSRSFMHGGRTMGRYSEAFVLSTSPRRSTPLRSRKGAGRDKSGFSWTSRTADCRSSERSRDWRADTIGCMFVLKPRRRDTGFIARSRRLVTTARSGSDPETVGRAELDDPAGCGHVGAAVSGRRTDGRVDARRGSRSRARSCSGLRGGGGRSSAQTQAAAFLPVASQPDLQRRRPLDVGSSALAGPSEV
jgi:hypothetical protein